MIDFSNSYKDKPNIELLENRNEVMKKFLFPIFISACVASSSLQSEIIPFDLSPPGTDNAVGLSPANEVPPVTNSDGSGGEVFTGIILTTPPDTLANELSVSIGYGTWPGFTDLTGPISAAHIHGPAAVGENAPPIFDLFPLNFSPPSSFPYGGGIIVGTFELTNDQVDNLRDGLYYINLHTEANLGGEIRGQLIPHTNVPPEIVKCPQSMTVECTSPKGKTVALLARVEDTDGDELRVIWEVNGDVVEEFVIPSGGETTSADVPFIKKFPIGKNTVVLTVVDDDGEEDSCELTVTVEDTKPPVIKRIVADPRVLWPPNHKFKTVRLKVDARDACGEVKSKIVRVRSNEPINGNGDGNTWPDWKIVDDLVVWLRAERSGRGSGRIYTIVVKVTDEAGNSTIGRTQVKVPHSMGNKNKGNNK